MPGVFFYDGGLRFSRTVTLLEYPMDSFDPRLIAVRSAHFIGGQYRDAAPGLTARASIGAAWEAQTLRAMSRAYVAEARAAEDPTRPPPWAMPEPEDRAALSKRIGEALRARARPRTPQ